MANFRFETYGNTSQADISDYYITADGYIVHRYNILTTSVICYKVYMQCEQMRGYTSWASNRALWEGWLGDITTMELPADLDALPKYSDERYVAVRAFQNRQRTIAERCVKEGWPEDFGM